MSSNKISEWFYRYNKDIYHFLIYYTGSSDIEDLVQEVFYRAIKSIDTFKEQSSPKTWLFSIARNVGIDEIRKKKRIKLRHALLEKEFEDKKEKSPESILHLNEQNKILYQTIHTLKRNYRDVIILRGIKEFSVSETAQVLNWSENKVRITYHRALLALQKKKEELH
ncbi:RNA polymerase sigma factor [Rossellomorea vietnamensis]|uniref:RNA polymerase sigma factor n=1 Tax=Rossellomorea vietnamensis TaxID=218284 RepID=A0A5D4NT43_9BACI|nr:RNA polymerase sigma factor [Rossellomorea vietnamensis]TYS17513.1 RNA polymerase sigma factor [Rossellomorea vietnamensis]